MEVNEKDSKIDKKGVLKRISGPVVTAVNFDAHMYDVVKVGNEALMGEVIKIQGEETIIQVYEDTSGIKPGEPVVNTGLSLAVELGPGLLTNIYDGIQRPLSVLVDKMGNFIERGVSAPGLPHDKKWEFVPLVKEGDKVIGGSIIGEVQETNIVHKVMVPPNLKGGAVKSIKSGSFTVDEVVCVLEDGTSLNHDAALACAGSKTCKRKAEPGDPVDYRSADTRRALPDRKRRHSSNPWPVRKR